MARALLGLLTACLSIAHAAPTLADVYDVTDPAYGADPISRTNDDAPAIQAALDDAGIDGGTVYIPAGHYATRRAIRVPRDNVKITGDGLGTVIEVHHDTGHALVVDGNRHVVIRDLRVRAFAHGFSRASGVLVTGNARDILIENARFEDLYVAVEIDPDVGERAEHITLRNVWAEGAESWGIELFRAKDVLLDNVFTTRHGNDGFKIGEGSANWEIRGGRSWANGGDGVDTLGTGKQWIINGARFDNNRGAGINVKTGFQGDSSEGSIIGAVAVENAGPGLDFFVGDDDPHPHHVSVQSGLFARNRHAGIRVQAGRNITLDRVVVVENASDGILIEERCSEIDVLGAQVSTNGLAARNTYSGIRIAGDRIRVRGGSMNGKSEDAPETGSRATHEFAIFVTDEASDVVVEGLSVKNASRRLVRDDGTNTTWTDIDGYTTRAEGTAELAATATRHTVRHGLAVAPDLSQIRVTPSSPWGHATQFWVSSPNANDFTIHVDTPPGHPITFLWQTDAAR